MATVSTCLLALAAGRSAFAGLVLPQTIDDFTDTNSPDFPLVVAAGIQPTSVTSEVGLNGVIGGGRRTSLELDGTTGLAAGFVDDSNLYFEVSSSLNTLATLSFDYGVSGGFEQLNANVADSFGIEISLADFDFASDEGIDVSVALESGGEIRTSSTLISTGGPQSIVLGFASFSPGGGGGFTLSDIDGISVSFEFRGGADFQIDSIRTVVDPIPAPGALATMALAVMGGRRRRRAV